jgi:hypothetical protein
VVTLGGGGGGTFILSKNVPFKRRC